MILGWRLPRVCFQYAVKLMILGWRLTRVCFQYAVNELQKVYAKKEGNEAKTQEQLCAKDKELSRISQQLAEEIKKQESSAQTLNAGLEADFILLKQTLSQKDAQISRLSEE
ncbi:MAG: hypothetical protein ACK559_17050, partial [bacterium]